MLDSGAGHHDRPAASEGLDIRTSRVVVRPPSPDRSIVKGLGRDEDHGARLRGTQRSGGRVDVTSFDPVSYKRSTRDQWQAAADAWRRWGPVTDSWLREGTDVMLDLVQVQAGARVLDVAAGAGGQSFAAARRVGPQGEVPPTDLSENLVQYLEQDAAAAGLTQVRAAVMDAEDLRVPPERFDAVICRLGLIYLPNREAALRDIRAALRPGGRLGAIVYSPPEANRFFSVPVSIIRRAAQLPPPLPGQPGPFSLGTPEVLRHELEAAGFVDVDVRVLPAELRLASAEKCV